MVSKGSDGYPRPSSPAVTRVMKAVRRVDTSPEVKLRSALHRGGYRFRKDMALVVGGQRCRPDIVFTRQMVAVFVDGCLWHSCPYHGHQPRLNTDYWQPKLRRTRERDKAETEALRASGWEVIRIWEHMPIAEAYDLVTGILNRRLKGTNKAPP